MKPICAGFDQNVARICKLSGTIKSQQKDQLSIGMASVLHEHPCKNIAAIQGFPNELLVYEDKINCGGSSFRLQNCTIVNPTELILAGSSFDIKEVGESMELIVNNWITFQTRKTEGGLLGELKKKFDCLFDHKFWKKRNMLEDQDSSQCPNVLGKCENSLPQLRLSKNVKGQESLTL